MRSVEELIDNEDPGISLIREWIEASDIPCRILPPSDARGEVLSRLQVTTRSPLGAVAHDTGGILIQNGWVRFLGSGHEALPRRLDRWNEGRPDGYLLIADDAVGGFFALNGGALGNDPGQAYYAAPDDTGWIALDMGYAELLGSLLTRRIDDFYRDLRWPTWQEDLAGLPPDRAFVFYPFLWSKEGSVGSSHRSSAPVEEIYALRKELVGQLRA